MNTQILAYIHKPHLKETLESLCKNITGFPPVIHHCISELDSMLGLLRSVDVLIMEKPEDNSKTDLLFDKLISGRYDIRKVVLIGWKREIKNAYFLPYNEIDNLSSLLKDVVEEAPEMAWAKFPLHALLHFNSLPFDLYIKISEEKYLKRVPAFETVEESTIHNFNEHGILELHFQRQHIKDFSRMLINSMINKVERENDDHAEKLKARSEVFSTVKDIIHGLGLNPKIVYVCESLLEGVTSDVKKEKGTFSSYLEKLQNNPDLAFHYKFIELTSFIGSQMIFTSEENDQHEQLRLLIYSAFFSDMTLSREDLLHYMDAESMNGLTMEDKTEVHEHAWMASQLLAKSLSIPLEVSTIVLQHHGSVVGTGFPGKRAGGLLPLSKYLIVSQELAYALLTQRESTPLEVLKKIKDLNAGTTFEELLIALEYALTRATI